MKVEKPQLLQCLLVCIIVIFLFAFLPSVSAAECDAITGSSSYVLFPVKVPHLGSPRVVPNPDYVTQTEQERKFTPKEPYSPFDNFRVVMGVSGLAGDGARVANFRARLIAEDDAGKEETIWEGAMHREKIDYTQQLDSGTFVADINGYPNGLGGETLIDAIAKNRKIFIRVERLCPFYRITEHISKRYALLPKNMQYEIVPNPDTQSGGWDPEEYPTSFIADEKAEIPMQGRLTNCAQIYGSGEHNFASLRLLGLKIPPNSIVSQAKIDYETIINISPFKEYSGLFSFYVDLKEFDLPNRNDEGQNTDEMFLGLDTKHPDVSKSSCAHMERYILYANWLNQIFNSPLVYMEKSNMFRTSAKGRRVVAHEIGHNYCLLGDEGARSNGWGKATPSNCAWDPFKAYSYKDTLYGRTDVLVCGSAEFHRPTLEPTLMNPMIMGPQLDAVSCAHCLAKIKGGPAKSYFPECMMLDTIKPDCTKNNCPQDFACNTASKLCEKNT